MYTIIQKGAGAKLEASMAILFNQSTLVPSFLNKAITGLLLQAKRKMTFYISCQTEMK